MKKIYLFPLATLIVAPVVVGTATPAFAAGAEAPPVIRIGTMTRGARVFGDAEAALVAALKAKDTAALERLVAPDFEQLTPSSPGAPVPREDWIKQSPAEVAHSSGLRDIAVHDYGDINVVSFVWTRDPPQAPAFVVDVWQRKPGGGDAWQLSTRYLSPAPASSSRRRASPASAPASVDPKR